MGAAPAAQCYWADPCLLIALLQNVRLARCGFKGALAPLESAGEGGRSGKETPEETAQRLKREAAEARGALK